MSLDHLDLLRSSSKNIKSCVPVVSLDVTVSRPLSLKPIYTMSYCICLTNKILICHLQCVKYMSNLKTTDNKSCVQQFFFNSQAFKGRSNSNSNGQYVDLGPPSPAYSNPDSSTKHQALNPILSSDGNMDGSDSESDDGSNYDSPISPTTGKDRGEMGGSH